MASISEHGFASSWTWTWRVWVHYKWTQIWSNFPSAYPLCFLQDTFATKHESLSAFSMQWLLHTDLGMLKLSITNFFQSLRMPTVSTRPPWPSSTSPPRTRTSCPSAKTKSWASCSASATRKAGWWPSIRRVQEVTCRRTTSSSDHLVPLNRCNSNNHLIVLRSSIK